MGSGAVSHSQKQKTDLKDPTIHEKRLQQMRDWHKTHKEEESRKKKERLDRRMATFISFSPGIDYGCYTDKPDGEGY